MSTSLFNRRLRWTDVARLLGIGFEDYSLPTLVTCPLCQGHALHVYEDKGARGAWFHCRQCEKGGDCVSFLSLAWEVDVPAVIDRLIGDGLLPAVSRESADAYVALVAGKNDRMVEFWKAASANLPAGVSPTTAATLHALQINTALSPERWRAGMATLVGAATKGGVERLFFPNAELPGGHRNRSSDKIFRGHGWGDVLVLPYHSAAGRMSGFTFVGRRNCDRLFAPVRVSDSAARKDVGLYAPHAADGHGTVVAVPDAAFALKLHGRHFATSGRFLNLIGWVDDGTHATGQPCWQQLNGKRVVHWVREIDAAVIRQAALFEADVSLAGPEKAEHTDHYCRQLDPVDLMKRVCRMAKPWRYALSEWVRDAHPVAVESLARRLAAYQLDPNEIARSLPDREAGDRLYAVSGPKRGLPGLRFVAYDKGVIESCPDGWHYADSRKSGIARCHRTRTRITDFALTVHEIRVTDDTEVYDCDVLFRGRLHPVEIDPREPIARQLLRAGVGVVFVAPRWGDKLLHIAATLDPPKITRA